MEFETSQEGGPEWEESEKPALIQLVNMGYTYVGPSKLKLERKMYRQAVLYDRLKKAIKNLNPWISDENLDLAVDKIGEDSYRYDVNVVDTNEKIHAKLTELSRSSGLVPLTVQQDLGDGLEEQTVHVIDFDDPENNDFVVTNQFIYQGYRKTVYPDIVAFVNGIPLVVIECKKPSLPEPLISAWDNNLGKYQEGGKGLEKLFYYNLFIVATAGVIAKYGTAGADINKYEKWTDAYPLEPSEIKEFAKRDPRDQEILLAGMLYPKTLLSILKDYVIFNVVNDKKIKFISRHQQMRVVTKCVEQIRKIENTTSNHGGVIWHTQGSGKSYSMMYLAQHVKKTFGDKPILVITDRRSLDRQITQNFRNAGYVNLVRARTIEHLTEEIKNPANKTIMTTLQKFADADISSDERFIVLTDESHRTEYKILAAKMRNALKNAIFFAFTATPIDKPNRSTFNKFGEEIDSYTWEESIRDGKTVEIVYQGQMPHLYVDGSVPLNKLFDGLFPELTDEQKAEIKKRYVTLENIQKAPERIKLIAKNIKEHFESALKPNGYKAMLVTPSKEAAVRYKKALDSIDAPQSKIIMTSERDDRGSDGESWEEYYIKSSKREEEAEKFTSPSDPNQILIVVDMFLTGYDAPIVQTMYLDQRLKEHTLLQAIARVNRKYDVHKKYGFIVDYCGISKNLKEAQEMFDHEQTKKLYTGSDNLLPQLEAARKKAMVYLEDIDPKDSNQIILKFKVKEKLDSFNLAIREFSAALDAVLPDPKAIKYLDDFNLAKNAKQIIKNWLEQDKFSPKPYSNKVQQFLDEHIRAEDLTTVMGNRPVTHETFLVEIGKFKDKRARNALIRRQCIAIIKERGPDNPSYYEELDERLKRIINDEEGRREESADYFGRYQAVFEGALHEADEREKLGFENPFEFAVFGKIQEIVKDSEKSKELSEAINQKILSRMIIDWKDKQTPQDKMKEDWYDILKKNGIDTDKILKLMDEMMNLARRLL